MAKSKKPTVEDQKKGKVDFLEKLREKGVELPMEDIAFLNENGNIGFSAFVAPEEDSDEEGMSISFKFNPDLTHISPTEAKADEAVVILEPSVRSETPVVILTSESYNARLKVSNILYGYKTDITKADWLPKSLETHDKKFRAWIDSVNAKDGFWNSIYYDKFAMYCRQADQWEREFQDIHEDNKDYRRKQVMRMRENSLFAMNRYLELKEASAQGLRKYSGTKAHKILLFLLDSGYSLDIAKARQIAFTTTLCAWALLKAMFNIDVQIKYISESDAKARRTFNDRIRYPFGRFPKWARPNVANDPIDYIAFGTKEEKGVISGNNSVVEVVAPTKTAVASSSPTVVLVDEAGQIPVLQDILSDNIPTMKGYNPRTKRQEILRQMVLWGTGGYMSSIAGQAFKSVYMSHYEAWQNGADTLFVPLVLNVWYRPGWTRADQEKERKVAYAVTGPEKETARTRFHQSFPEDLDDIFKTSGVTLLSEEWISEQIERLRKKGVNTIAQYGYFEPQYDTSTPAHEGSDVPFKITGATFVKCDKLDARVSTVILDDRRPWKNRYYEGTDPIASDSGLSDMSSTIWDALWNTPVALMVFRSQDYRQAYLQSVLLGIYYDTTGAGAVPHLVEANIGTALREYIINKGLERSLVVESELPEIFQTAKMSVKVGIDNKGLRNRAIITEMKNVFLTFGANIWIETYFKQLRTFVEKNAGKGVTWEPMDKRINRDDALFSLVYSYICAVCFATKRPEELDTRPGAEIKITSKLVRQKDGTLTRVMVKKKVEAVRKEIANGA